MDFNFLAIGSGKFSTSIVGDFRLGEVAQFVPGSGFKEVREIKSIVVSLEEIVGDVGRVGSFEKLVLLTQEFCIGMIRRVGFHQQFQEGF